MPDHPDIMQRAREALDRLGKFGEVEWDSYTVPGDHVTWPYTAVEIGEHEIELRWLMSALVGAFIAESPDLVRELAAEVEKLRATVDRVREVCGRALSVQVAGSTEGDAAAAAIAATILRAIDGEPALDDG